MSSYPPPPEPIGQARPILRRGRDRDLSNPTHPIVPAFVRRSSTSAHWQLWLLFVVLCSLAIAVLVPGLLGIYVGLDQRASFLRQRAEDHYKQALLYASEDYSELAVAELQLALKFDPDYQAAIDKLKTLELTPTANGTSEPNSATIADQLFARAQTSLAGQQWSDAIDSLEEIRRVDAQYRAGEVTSLLVTAYMNGGKQSITAGQIQQAQARFEAALNLDPSNAEAKTLRDRAVLYLNGTQAVDADWQAAAVNFQKLYQQDPNFFDVKKQLLNAYLQYGDVASRTGAFCVAAREYDQALRLGAGPDANSKLATANASCKQAVTAPTVTPTALALGGPFSGSAHAVTTAPCQGTGDITGTVRDAQSNPLPRVTIQIYNDFDYRPPPFTTDKLGKYTIILGKDAGVFHLVIDGANGTAASSVVDVKYPGGAVNGCHWIVDWTRNE